MGGAFKWLLFDLYIGLPGISLISPALVPVGLNLLYEQYPFAVFVYALVKADVSKDVGIFKMRCVEIFFITS